MKIAKRAVTGIGIILVLAILAAILSNIVFGYQLRKTLAGLQAAERPVTIAELRNAPMEYQNLSRSVQDLPESKGDTLKGLRKRSLHHCAGIQSRSKFLLSAP